MVAAPETKIMGGDGTPRRLTSRTLLIASMDAVDTMMLDFACARARMRAHARMGVCVCVCVCVCVGVWVCVRARARVCHAQDARANDRHRHGSK
jgi:hypothetical protein